MSWQEALGTGLVVYSHVVLVYFLAISLHYVALTVFGAISTYREQREVEVHTLREMMHSQQSPPISVIAPAYNESVCVVESVHSLLMLHYPLFEVILVNDGSTDDTLELLIERYDLRPVSRRFEYSVPCKPIRGIYESLRYPNLVVVDKVNGGSKADATNAGVNVSLYPAVCVVDADSVLEHDALLRAARPFVSNPEETVACGGTVRIANGCEIESGRVVGFELPRSLLARIQIVEYLRAFLFARMAWSNMNGLLIISGAFGLFNKRSVIAAGGYESSSLGEDMELVLKLQREVHESEQKRRIGFVPDPVCWTEVPEDWESLARQRNRWHRGLLDTLWRHRDMIGRPKYGVTGTVALPAFVVFELLGPIVELTGYLAVAIAWAAGLLNLQFMGTFLLASFLLGMLYSITAVLLDDLAFRRTRRMSDLLRLVLAGVVEHFGFRQISCWWRVRAVWDYLRGRRGWGTMRRRGLGAT